MIETFFSDVVIPLAVRFGVALLILAVGLGVARLLLRLLRKLLLRSQVDEVFVRFAVSIANILLLAFVAILALHQVGVDAQYLFAILTGLLVAVGLALQDSLTNVAAGMRLFLQQPFRQGEQVQIGETKGNVVEISVMTTHLRTGDQVDVILPNSAVVQATLQNFHSRPQRRIDMVVRIRYESDLALAMDTLLDIMHADERVLEEPPPKVTVADLEETGIRLNVRPWVKNSDHGSTKADLLEQFVIAFQDEGIQFAYPTVALQNPRRRLRFWPWGSARRRRRSHLRRRL